MTYQKNVDLTRTLAEYVAAIKYEDLPAEAVEATKRIILEDLGLVALGSTAQGCDIIAGLAAECGHESHLLPSRRWTTAVNAALANSAQAHAWELDDTDDRTGCHVGAVTIPAALAVAERVGKVSGRDFITACCLGMDVGIRMFLAVWFRKPVGPRTAATAPFCAAVAAGKLLGLDAAAIEHALGIAYSQVAFAGIGLEAPSLVKRLKAGAGSAAGVYSALLAEKGFTSSPEFTLDGAGGFYRLFYGVDPDLNLLLRALGRTYEVVNISAKPYSCCRMNHAAIDATLALMQEHDIKPGDVEKVKVHVPMLTYRNLCGGDDPAMLARKRRPRGVIDAQFSIPWTVAVAIVKRRVFIDSFTDEGLADPAVLDLAAKVTPVHDPGLSQIIDSITPAIVEIAMKSGDHYSKRVDTASGNIANRWTWAEYSEKYRKCAAEVGLGVDRTQHFIKIVSRLEDLDDVSRLIPLLSIPGKK